jgi:hypothetical protein
VNRKKLSILTKVCRCTGLKSISPPHVSYPVRLVSNLIPSRIQQSLLASTAGKLARSRELLLDAQGNLVLYILIICHFSSIVLTMFFTFSKPIYIYIVQATSLNLINVAVTLYQTKLKVHLIRILCIKSREKTNH